MLKNPLGTVVRTCDKPLIYSAFAYALRCVLRKQNTIVSVRRRAIDLGAYSTRNGRVGNAGTPKATIMATGETQTVLRGTLMDNLFQKLMLSGSAAALLAVVPATGAFAQGGGDSIEQVVVSASRIM